MTDIPQFGTSVSEPMMLEHQYQHEQPVAVVDVGSNSVRLVLFKLSGRVPVTIFNEKTMCGLGATMADTGKLNPDGVELALAAAERFNLLIKSKNISEVHCLATAAVRDASDGAAFARAFGERLGADVQIISGEEEGRLSAMGVICGIPFANGIVADLGGGSLELVDLEDQEIGDRISLPLGPQRLVPEDQKNALQQNKAMIDERFANVSWLHHHKGRKLYLVGGAWRAIARLQMIGEQHPVEIVHEHELHTEKLLNMCQLLSKLGPESLDSIKGMSRRRRDTLPKAALVLERLLTYLQPEAVIFSAYGLREGIFFDNLEDSIRDQDPLLFSCARVAWDSERHPGFGRKLVDWTDECLGELLGHRNRLRRAACLLSDIAWYIHPDYRADHAVDVVMRFPFAGMDHQERAFLAIALNARYGESSHNKEHLRELGSLIGDQGVTEAEIIGRSLRLGYTLSSGTPELLNGTRLYVDGHLRLKVTSQSRLKGESVYKRLRAMAKRMNLAPEIET